MATYQELSGIRGDDTAWGNFLGKVRVAAVVKATAVIDSVTPGEAVLSWAKATIANPVSAGDGIVWYVVGSNNGVAIASIYSASDPAIQTNINEAVDAIYGS